MTALTLDVSHSSGISRLSTFLINLSHTQRFLWLPQFDNLLRQLIKLRKHYTYYYSFIINSIHRTSSEMALNEGLPSPLPMSQGVSDSQHITVFTNQQSPLSFGVTAVSQSCLTLCNPMDYSTPGFPVFHQLPELAQTNVHWVGDGIQPSHPLSFPSPPAFNLSQH